LALIKGLELAGFEPVVLIVPADQGAFEQYYRLAGVKEVYLWDDPKGASEFVADAEAMIEQIQCVHDLMKYEFGGARVGKIAASTTLRQLRSGSLDLRASGVRHLLVERLAESMGYAAAAQNFLARVAPDCALFYDMVYTRRGELFDKCLLHGVDTIRWHPAHKSNTLMLKRYTLANRDHHPVSLSAESWEFMSRIRWTDSHRAELQHELAWAYATGDWYPESGTQFGKRIIGTDEIREQIGLDPSKKTAFIFPHILWDAPHTWGESLFDDYEQWLIETVRAACVNDEVNWVIKIHPANAGKQLKERFQGEPAEVVALRQNIGELPGHVFMIPAESEISTFSIYQVMDYCLTVRGTVGVEAASFGIPVLTAGTGRYDRKGFTIDSDSCDEYLRRISHIQDIPRLSSAQRELAERFAYGVFLLRPFPLCTVSLDFHKDHGADNSFTKTRINVTSQQDWHNAPDLRTFAQWVGDAGSQDFLMPIGEG
jgi:hypothetical protein